MPEGELPERPGGTLTTEDKTQRKEQPPLASFMEKNLFDKLSQTPAGEDPAYWPLPMLHELNYHIVTRHEMRSADARAIGERYAPMKESIRKVTKAYEILAYPHCKDWGSRENIEDELATDQVMFERDHVELDDAELKILSKLTAARKLPFDPQKRNYQYSEVLNAASQPR